MGSLALPDDTFLELFLVTPAMVAVSEWDVGWNWGVLFAVYDSDSGLTFMIYTRATKTPSGLVFFPAEASKTPRGLLYSRPPSFPPTLIVTSFVLIDRLIESLTTGSA